VKSSEAALAVLILMISLFTVEAYAVAAMPQPGLWSRKSNFRAPAPTSENFRLRNDLVEKTLYHLYNSLAQQTVCWKGTQISGSGSTIWNFLAPAPAIQNCLGSGYTTLLTTAWVSQSQT